MLKRTLSLMTVICAGLVLFTTSAISSEKSSDKVITSEEMQKINLSHSFKGPNTLKKIPSMLETAPMVPELKMYKQSLAQINKVKEKIQSGAFQKIKFQNFLQPW